MAIDRAAVEALRDEWLECASSTHALTYTSYEKRTFARCAERLDALLASPPEGTSQDAETEKRIRAYLWLSHGHEGAYGDDGEMQCGMCARFGLWDYKREPLARLIETVEQVCLERLQQAFPPSPASQEAHEPEEQR